VTLHSAFLVGRPLLDEGQLSDEAIEYSGTGRPLKTRGGLVSICPVLWPSGPEADFGRAPNCSCRRLMRKSVKSSVSLGMMHITGMGLSEGHRSRPGKMVFSKVPRKREHVAVDWPPLPGCWRRPLTKWTWARRNQRHQCVWGTEALVDRGSAMPVFDWPERPCWNRNRD